MKLGLVEVNDVRFVVDHIGNLWRRQQGKNGDYYWEGITKELAAGYRGHCEMVKYIKESVYHNYRDVAACGNYINVRKRDRNKPKFVTVNIPTDE